MEYYDWSTSNSRKNIEKLFGEEAGQLNKIGSYSESVSKYMNEGIFLFNFLMGYLKIVYMCRRK